MVYAWKLILTVQRIREFVISVQLIIYAKQNGVKYTTISATGTMAQIAWRRLLLGHGDEVGSFQVTSMFKTKETFKKNAACIEIHFSQN